MYNRELTKIVDRREMLRVKLKCLAIEAKFIRREELRLGRPQQIGLREELRLHRVGIVRRVARDTHLAYGFIKGYTLEKMEKNCYDKDWTSPTWDAIYKMVRKYGSASDAFHSEVLMYAQKPRPAPGAGQTCRGDCGIIATPEGWPSGLWRRS